MHIAWVATSASVGFTTKPLTFRRNIRKASASFKICAIENQGEIDNRDPGKYLLERERLVKENNWKLEG